MSLATQGFGVSGSVTQVIEVVENQVVVQGGETVSGVISGMTGTGVGMRSEVTSGRTGTQRASGMTKSVKGSGGTKRTKGRGRVC